MMLKCASALRGRRIFIAIPSYGEIPVLTVHSLLESQGALEKAGFAADIAILAGRCHVDDARNIMVAEFLQTDCEALIFIDADMSWDPDSIVRLANHDRDVVAVAYPKKQDNQRFTAVTLPGEIWSDAEGLIPVRSTGTGFMKIKRQVLQNFFDESPKFRTGEADVDCAEIFVRTIDNGERVSGDVAFCYRVRATGTKVFVDPEVRIGHVGSKLWQGSYGSYLRKNAGLALTTGINKIKAGNYNRMDVPAMVDDWDNDGFAAGHELVASCIEAAQKAEGPILEIGSGLTSLVMAATGAEVHALESDIGWYTHMLAEKERLDLDSLNLYHAPLIDQEGGRWYSKSDWPAPDIVVCDGPKRGMGNRDVLFSKLNGHVPRLLLMDDREAVDGELKLWAESHDFDVNIVGELRQFAVGKLDDGTSVPIL